MKSFRLASVIFLALLFLFSSQEVFAHGGGHKPEEKKDIAPPAMDSMYSAEENDPLAESTGDSLGDVFSPTDLFTADELAPPDPMPAMNMEGHGGHQEPQVEISRHQLVSPSSKGFGTAVGITLFAGLAFAGLTFLRPGE